MACQNFKITEAQFCLSRVGLPNAVPAEKTAAQSDIPVKSYGPFSFSKMAVKMAAEKPNFLKINLEGSSLGSLQAAWCSLPGYRVN